MSQALRKESFTTAYPNTRRNSYEPRNIKVKPRTAKNELKQSEISAKIKSRIMSIVLIVGMVFLGVVLFAAYNSSIAFQNENAKKENAALKGEVEYLQIQVEAANNVRTIEDSATGQLGMVYPEEDQYVVLKETKAAKAESAVAIDKKAKEKETQ